MHNPKNVAIIGCSGHANVAADILSLMTNVRVEGFLCDGESTGIEKYGYPVLGSLVSLDELIRQNAVNAVFVAIGDNAVRGRLTREILERHRESLFISAIHPSASVSSRSSLAAGCLIAAGAVVGPGATVGFGSIVNTNASLDHDSTMGLCSSLAPKAATGGNVTIGDYTAVGIGACVNHSVQIGSDSVVGSGAVVINDVAPRTVAFGIPAKVRAERQHGDSYL